MEISNSKTRKDYKTAFYISCAIIITIIILYFVLHTLNNTELIEVLQEQIEQQQEKIDELESEKEDGIEQKIDRIEDRIDEIYSAVDEIYEKSIPENEKIKTQIRIDD